MNDAFDRLAARAAPAIFVLLWSTGFVATKYVLHSAEPLTYLAIRMAIVVGLMAIIVIATRPPWPDWAGVGHSIVAGLLVHGFYLGGTAVAIAHSIPAGLSALMPGLQPILTSTIANRWLGERVTPLQWMGLLLGLAGVVLILHDRPLTGEAGWGWLASLASLLSITLGTLYQGRYEVGTARTLREHRKVTDALVAKHGGRLVKTTGDGELLEFPSVVDAVECAVAVQAVMAERNQGVPDDRLMLFRIGINLGDILIEGDDILGDGVNVAARLEGIAEPGGICISSSAYEQVRGKVSVDFTDLGEHCLKNIARPIRAYAFGVNANIDRAVPPLSSAPRLSMVVLPFVNLGGDPEQEYFVDGVTESLTTDLSRINGAFVIARNTAFTFKGKAVDVTKLGRELNVRYVLEGSVQRSGNRLRVNVQLIDAETGSHLWAERFDKPVGDLFEVQDEIVSRLANTLNAELIKAEAQRAERSPRPDATDLYFQGKAFFNKGVTPALMARARDFFVRALALDPDNIEAAVSAAHVDFSTGASHMADDGALHFKAAESTLNSALLRAPNHPRAHMLLGGVQIRTNRAAKGIAECRQALTLDRNLAEAHAFIGLGKHALGHNEEVEEHIQEALRLSPRDTRAFLWFHFVGMAKLHAKADLEALDWLCRSIEANPNYSLCHFHLAGVLAMMGDLLEARSSADAGLALDPNFTIRRRRMNEWVRDTPVWLARRERFYEGLHLAGVPEG